MFLASDWLCDSLFFFWQRRFWVWGLSRLACLSFLSGRRNRWWFFKRSFSRGRCRGLGRFLRNCRRRWFGWSRGWLSHDRFGRLRFRRFCLWRCRHRFRRFDSPLFLGYGLFRFRFASLHHYFLGHFHVRGRSSARPCGSSTAIDEVGVQGPAGGMQVHRAFKFSVNHISIIKRVLFVVGVGPGERAKSGCIIVLIPAAVPGCSLAGFWSAIPNKSLTVFGLLVLAFAKRSGGANEPQAAKQNRSPPQSGFHKCRGEVNAAGNSGNI